MKKIAALALLLAAGLCCAGCVVRSIHPWLSDESRVADPSLLGAWHDVQGHCIAFFSDPSSANAGYDVLLVQNGKEVSRFTASLHRIDGALLLLVGPDAPDNLNGCALLPGYLLLRAALDGASLRLHGIDLESFEARAAKSQVPLLAHGSESEGFTLTGTTADSEAFLRAQLADPEFFDETPLYSFQKLPDAAP